MCVVGVSVKQHTWFPFGQETLSKGNFMTVIVTGLFTRIKLGKMGETIMTTECRAFDTVVEMTQ